MPSWLKSRCWAKPVCTGETLDVDITIAGLMSGIFGTAKFMDAQRRGGQSRSTAKIEASRTNGAKGGRPRKTS